MNKRFILLLLIFYTASSLLTAQFSDDFSDGNLDMNPLWLGDIDHFKINESGALQLNAATAGTSSIYTLTGFSDTTIWDMEFLLDFAPSNDNRLEIFLQSDTSDWNIANGYSIRVGESGSGDALSFFRIDNGIRTEIAKAQEGSLGTDPAGVSFQLLRINGVFELWTNYNNAGCLEFELSFSDDIHPIETGKYFGISCIYTTTRTDKFYFDNINLGSKNSDVNPPILLNGKILEPLILEIEMNEGISTNSALKEGNYLLNGSAMDIKGITQSGTCQEKISIELNTGITGGKLHELTIKELSDLNGNVMSQDQSITVYLTEEAEPGEIHLSEILFNPHVGGSDYIELYNSSDKIIDLSAFYIVNRDKEEFKQIEEGTIILPETYLAFTEDSIYVVDRFLPSPEARIQTQDIPSFNDSDGNISLETDGIVWESFDYNEDFHFELIKDPEGVSLERISFQTSAELSSNWFSASSVSNYGTPGYRNSQSAQFLPNPNIISLTNRIFSPDQDGFEDQLFIKINPEKAGFLATIQLFDLEGYSVKTIGKNLLLSLENTIVWDGLNDNLQRVSMGSYIIIIELFHPDGDKLRFQESCIVAQKLK